MHSDTAQGRGEIAWICLEPEFPHGVLLLPYAPPRARVGEGEKARYIGLVRAELGASPPLSITEGGALSCYRERGQASVTSRG